MARLLFLIGTLGSGGSERQLTHILRAAAGAGHEVSIAVWNFSEGDPFVSAARESGAAIHPLGGGTAVQKFLRLRRVVRSFVPDVLHSYSFYLNPVVAVAAAGTGALAVGSVRSALASATSDTGRFLGRVSSRWPRNQIYNNWSAAEEAKRHRWFRPRCIVVVENHLDMRAFSHVDPPDGPAQILGIGSLLQYKRWDRLVETAARMRDAGLETSVKIIGEGPSRPGLEALIAEKRLGNSFVLAGHTTDVPAALAACSFVVHVSDTEGTPNAVVEAMAAGRAVVATDVGDVRHHVIDGETGFVVPREDSDALFDRIRRLVTDRDLAVRLGRRARGVAQARYANELLIGETLAAYREMGLRDSPSTGGGRRS